MNINGMRGSALVQYAREARRPTSWWLAALFIVFIGILGAQFVGQMLFGLFATPAEGSVSAQISEIVTKEAASYWVAGGAFGPENSLVVSVVWGIAAFIAYRYFTAGRPSSVDAPAGAARA